MYYNTVYCITVRSPFHLYSSVHVRLLSVLGVMYCMSNPTPTSRFSQNGQQLLLIFSSRGLRCLHATSVAANGNNLLCQLHKLEEKPVRDAVSPAKVSGLSGVTAFQLCFPEYCRPRRLGEIRSWVDLPSALHAGIIAVPYSPSSPCILYYTVYSPLYQVLCIYTLL